MEKILEWLNNNIPVVTGAAFAFCISLLTVREGSFRERLTKLQWIGIGTILVALVLLNI